MVFAVNTCDRVVRWCHNVIEIFAIDIAYSQGRSDGLWTVFTARRYARAVLAVIVCLSVCLSVTSRSCTKMAKPRIRLTMPYDSTETLVFRCQKS